MCVRVCVRVCVYVYVCVRCVVHLGAMQEAVTYQIKHWGDDWHDG